MGGQRGYTHIHLLVADLFDDSAVLGKAPLGDVHVGHHLNPRNNGQGEMNRRRCHFIKRAIDPVADPEVFLKGLEVNVGGLFLDRLVEN